MTSIDGLKKKKEELKATGGSKGKDNGGVRDQIEEGVAPCGNSKVEDGVKSLDGKVEDHASVGDGNSSSDMTEPRP